MKQKHEEHEKKIKELIHGSNLTRQDAEFILAGEKAGKISDVIVVDEKKNKRKKP